MKKSPQVPHLSLKDRRIKKSCLVGRRITQDDVANYVGVSRQTVAAWEHGKQVQSLEHAAKLAEFYFCSIDEMVGHKVATVKPA